MAAHGKRWKPLLFMHPWTVSHPSIEPRFHQVTHNLDSKWQCQPPQISNCIEMRNIEMMRKDKDIKLPMISILEAINEVEANTGDQNCGFQVLESQSKHCTEIWDQQKKMIAIIMGAPSADFWFKDLPPDPFLFPPWPPIVWILVSWWRFEGWWLMESLSFCHFFSLFKIPFQMGATLNAVSTGRWGKFSFGGFSWSCFVLQDQRK